jgi:asparagine synthase (glutamine-hydrolysing)
MCGLAGILNLKQAAHPQRAELARMIGMIRHRGPDGSGFHQEAMIGLAHVRLSIVDLATGTQPIHNEDNTLWVVFNGEIFNYLELREDLEQRGHRFYTHSDTEVIVHLYEEYGLDFPTRLNGQFAIALWDAPRERLVLVRDRVGILPLFYSEQNGRLLFASEIKAILVANGVAAVPNPVALDQLMSFWSPVSPQTMFDGVYEVAPGEIVWVERGKQEKKRYWDWLYPEAGACRSSEPEALAEELRALLVDATRLRLRADVPVGSYLSGGLDSSILASVIHRDGGVPLRTFSLGFSDESLDETVFQNEMVQHLGAQHSYIRCGPGDIAQDFVETIWHTELPVLRTAPTPLKRLSSLVRASDYKVVLTGEGADEVFGGYDIFKEAKIRRFLAMNPASTWRPLLLKRLYPYLDLGQGRGSSYLDAFFGVGRDQPDVPWFSHLPRWLSTAKCKEFFSAELRQTLTDDPVSLLSRTLPPAIGNWHPFHRGQYLEAKMLLPGYLLPSQGDRMLMANSVEGRFPYLDHRVIEFANCLHPRLKMRVLNEKYLLKRAMHRYIPNTIFKRHKQPYRAPNIPAFFQPKVAEYVEELMGERKLREYGYFDPAKTALLMRKIGQGRAVGNKDNMAFVGMLSTQIWHYLFIESFGVRLRAATAAADAIS